jgi:hypothetical protein
MSTPLDLRLARAIVEMIQICAVSGRDGNAGKPGLVLRKVTPRLHFTPFVHSAIRLSSLQSVCPLCNPFVLSAICLSSLQSVCLMHTTVLNCWHWQTSQCGAINTTSKTRNRSGHPQSLRTSSTSAISLAVSPAARLAGTQTIPPALPLPRHRVERNKKQCNFAGALSFTPPLL